MSDRIQPLVSLVGLSRADRADVIEKHRDAGICMYCGKAVGDGEAIYSITSEHYDCHLLRIGVSSQDLEKSSSYASDQRREKRTFLARAAGGHLIHTVDANTNCALCGHKPVSSKSRRMKPRSRWLRCDKVPDGQPECPRCATLRAGNICASQNESPEEPK